jgi:hypothetical protein
MQNLSRDVKNKHYLMLCELHYPGIHGKTEDSAPNIESHYFVYDRFDPITGISFAQLYDYQEYDTDNEYNSDSDIEDIYENRFVRINDEVQFLRQLYSNPANFNPQYFGYHPTIRNYHNIILNPNYIKPEIGEYIVLPTQEAIAILKTFWLRIIQKRWKKVFQERENIIRQRCHFSNLSIREMRGKWPESCFNLPGLRGMISDLK